MQQQNNVVRIPHLCDGIRYCRHRVEPCFMKRKQIDKDDVRVIVAEIFDLIGFWRRIFGEFKSGTRLVLQLAGDVGFGNAQCEVEHKQHFAERNAPDPCRLFDGHAFFHCPSKRSVPQPREIFGDHLQRVQHLFFVQSKNFFDRHIACYFHCGLLFIDTVYRSALTIAVTKVTIAHMPKFCVIIERR